MSQRECAGFNWPPLSIPAEEPISISPEAVSRAGCIGSVFQPSRSNTSGGITLASRGNCPIANSACCSNDGAELLCLPLACFPIAEALVRSPLARGVAHVANSTVLRLLSLFPASLLPFCAGVPAIGDGHPASFTCEPSIGCIFAPGLPAASSLADGVSHPDRVAACASVSPKPFPLPCFAFIASRRVSHVESDKFPALASGVGHDANCAIVCNDMPLPERSAMAKSGPLSAARGVGHPIEPVSNVRRTDARRRERTCPEGIAHGFQVSLYSVEPRFCVLARNLFTKERSRSALLDEILARGPEVTFVSKPCSLACRAERLAGKRSRPAWAVVWPSGASKSVTPDADTGAEMDLGKASEIVWSDVPEIAFIDDAIGYVSLLDEFSQPRRGLGVELGIEGRHGVPFKAGPADGSHLRRSS